MIDATHNGMALSAIHFDALRLLCSQTPIELRALMPDRRMSVRRFHDHDDAWRWAGQQSNAKAIYVVMNPFDATRIDGTAVGDRAILRRSRLLIDTDPDRATDTNATDDELQLALATSDRIRDYLASCGWPEPIEAMSGNGGHLLYLIDLPNDDESLALVEGVLAALAQMFDSSAVHVDTTVGNASRITKLYGTPVRKGPATPERPHRVSAITRIPERLTCVSVSHLQVLAASRKQPTPKTDSKGTSRYDIGRILAKLEVFRTTKKGDTTYHEIRCPWESAHSSRSDGPSGTIFTVSDDGRVGFKCQHHHCKDKRWPDVRAFLGIESRPHRVELIKASEVKVVKLEWVWTARLARGAITLFEGDAEKGKSTVLVDIAARISRGHSFPGERTTREPGNVVMMIAEDDLGATVVPRLIAAGADLDRIHFLETTRNERDEVVPFHLTDDCDRLRQKCQEVGAVFVVVDPLVSYLGSRSGRVLNTNNDLEVRKSLAPLKELAEQTRASVAAIRHYRKGKGTDALQAGGGSVGFAALVRVIVAALPDPEDDQRYLLAVAKNNLVPKNKRPAFSYEIVPSDDDPDTGRIAWGNPVEMSADEILLALAVADKEPKGKVADARVFLETFLISGEWVWNKDVFSAAKEMDGLNESAVRRAREELTDIVKVEKRGPKWFWRLERVPNGLE